MAIRKQLIWDKSKEKFVGTCDYGNDITIEDSETYASEVLVFMLVSLSGKLKWPVQKISDKKKIDNVYNTS